ncbi:metallophosphoesterase [Actinotalea sp. Marseille-Q4924]|uniref:metallophosphoesterase n=1 Tax=Actinotalea sp. Marseille-Q4924 TaxID=2866571 RepID=UPI001CE3FD60|nr:metallophosphoesterase [Actinotalea sp. Marseille-Q4924]
MADRGRSRRRTALRVAGVLGSIVLLLAVYGVAVEPRFVLDDRRYEVTVPGLGDSWAGTEVAVFSDLQVGMWWSNEGMIERIVDRVVAEDPAAALVGGDFVYSEAPRLSEQVDTVTRLLEPLRDAGVPTYVVLGNHDHAVGASEELTAAFEEMGFTVLRNEAAEVPAPAPAAGAEGEEPLHVVGLAATRPGLTDVDAALGGLPSDAPRVVMVHNPTAFPRLPAGTAPLAVAGHTHCGQIALSGTPGWSYLALTEEEKVVADGFAPEEYGAEGNSLFVTCGIGFSIVPVRINAAPQVVFFELVAP